MFNRSQRRATSWLWEDRCEGANLEPWDKGLTATTLRYPYELRDAKEYFDDIPNVELDPNMLKLAEQILQSKAKDFDPSQFADRYEEAVVKMLKRKQAGMPVSREYAPTRLQNAANLMEALRRSIAQEKGHTGAAKEGPQTRRAAGRDAASHSRQEGQGSRGKAGRTTKRPSEKGRLMLWRVRRSSADVDQGSGGAFLNFLTGGLR